MKLKYKIYYIFLAAVTVTIFMGLFKVLEIKNVDISQIQEAISEMTDLSIMNEDDGTDLRKFYNINKYDLEEVIYYSPKSNMEANEILIIKPKNENDIKSIEEKINSRVEKQSDSFKNYDMEQYEILSHHVLEEKSGYIILIISDDSKAIEQSINKIF
ncbi:DUF4358 domain-containing protein [uncultured Clostridium sp.]|uniref:DUF4358 domain-containing protein n=1 Tax=uncultured Clostridium sp. TaxID=59620 RepID=UPI00260026EB|nr:DUF4358 domain-containing protein [uncultured Clostridium sp.]